MSILDNEEWKDFVPESLDPAFTVVCPISYSEDFLKLNSFFEGILRDQEYSQRAFDLTTEIIRINTSNFNAWIHRQKCMKALNIPLENDFELCDRILSKSIKNYQAWMHRKYIVQNTNHFENELEFTNKILKMDAKNMHAWSHRYFVIQKYNLWDNEMKYTEELLKNDCRNNSVYVERFNVLKHFYSLNNNDSILEDEVSYLKTILQVTCHNESLWSYIRGIIREFDCEPIKQLEEFIIELSVFWSSNMFVFLCCSEIYRKHHDFEKCLNMYEVLLKICPYRSNLWHNLISTLPLEKISDALNEN